MDVEGTDGREHGEDQEFQRKSAVFSLASSDVSVKDSLGFRLDCQIYNMSLTALLPS
jgi:Root hair defective 3 GTP-binding protein (RHD3)